MVLKDRRILLVRIKENSKENYANKKICLSYYLVWLTRNYDLNIKIYMLTKIRIN